MSGGRLMSGWTAAWLQAGWTARRLLRGRMIWIAGVFALGPIGSAALLGQSRHGVRWEMLFAPLMLLCAIVAPLLAASTTADEIEDRTYTYLWSRPMPRWSVLAGKLIAAVPIAAVILCLTAAICFQLGHGNMSASHPWPAAALPRALGALSLAALALSMVAGGVAILSPRHGLGVSYAYLVVIDLPVAAMPFSIANLSTSHHIFILGGMSSDGAAGSPGTSALWLVGIGAFWLAIGLWRIARSEFASSEA